MPDHEDKTKMSEFMAACSCGSLMRQHPFFASTICLVMGLVFIAVPTGAILGIIAFFRTL